MPKPFSNASERNCRIVRDVADRTGVVPFEYDSLDVKLHMAFHIIVRKLGGQSHVQMRYNELVDRNIRLSIRKNYGHSSHAEKSKQSGE